MSALTPDEETTLKTYNKLAKQWSSAHLEPEYWKEEFAKFHELLPGGRLLEVGCGGGRDARQLIKMDYDYTGTDISAGLLSEAKQNNPGATFIQMSLYDLDFDEPFDGFWCMAVLLHIPKKRIAEALQAIRRNIKHDGVGCVVIKEGDSERIESDEEYDGDGRFFAYWRNDEFKQVLKANGFEVVAENYRPMSERTKWLVYYVRVI